MQNVPHNRHFKSGKLFFMLADGKHVQHGLGGVGVLAIASIDNADVRRGMFGYEMCCATQGMANHKHVDMHGLQVADGVQQAFAFGGGRGGDIHAQHVSRQPGGRQFKSGAGAGAVFEKQVDDGLAA